MRCILLPVALSLIGTLARADFEVRTIDSGAAGSAVVIIGVGSEYGESGLAVVRQLQSLKLTKGKLILVKSVAPFSESIAADLKWQHLESVSQVEALAPEAKRIILRESYDSGASSSIADGHTVTGKGGAAKLISQSMKQLPFDSAKKWRHAASGDTNEITVTTSSMNSEKEQRLSIRQCEHRWAALCFLKHLGMIEEADAHRVFSRESSGATRVAVYDDEGSISSSGHGPEWLRRELAGDEKLSVELINHYDIDAGALSDADVLVVGGGASSQQASGLGAEGREAIQRFVQRGGGYLGICAGAFLASTPSTKSAYLGLLPVESKSNTGVIITGLQWFDSPLGVAKQAPAKFSGGPTLLVQEGADAVKIWARFHNDSPSTELSKKLEGSPAVLAGKFGEGRVVLFSPHCERPPTTAAVFPQTIHWLAGIPAQE